jgi:hypothetical protein
MDVPSHLRFPGGVGQENAASAGRGRAGKLHAPLKTSMVTTPPTCATPPACTSPPVPTLRGRREAACAERSPGVSGSQVVAVRMGQKSSIPFTV